MSRVLKMSMPDRVYNDFIEDARDNYDDCYWLKMIADVRIARGIAGAVMEQEDVQETLGVVRRELIALVNQKYKEDVAPLKRKILQLQVELNKK